MKTDHLTEPSARYSKSWNAFSQKASLSNGNLVLSYWKASEQHQLTCLSKLSDLWLDLSQPHACTFHKAEGHVKVVLNLWVAHLLLSQLPVDLLAVAHVVDHRLGQLCLDAGQPCPQVAHVLIKLLNCDQRLLQLPHPAQQTDINQSSSVEAKAFSAHFVLINQHSRLQITIISESCWLWKGVD